MDDQIKEVLTDKEFAAKLNMCIKTFRTHFLNGKFAKVNYQKPGGSRRWSAQSVMKYINGRG